MSLRANFYQKSGATFAFNPWDLLALVIVLAIFTALGWAATKMSHPFNLGDQIPISLGYSHLPYYALESVLRMLIALAVSIVVTFVVGALAAKSKHAERIIIPCIDILQSVPVLGFLSITISGFIALFPGSLLGPQFCTIFVLFTAQVWNMIFGFYQSLRTLPDDLIEAARMFNLSPWQRFWRLEVPFAMPNLLWNMMVSMSQCWVPLTFSEAISVANQNIHLPGIGSYIFVAIQQANMHAIFAAIITMFIVIAFYDQLMFRPLIKWAEKFKFESLPDERPSRAWFTSLLHRTHLSRYLGKLTAKISDRFINPRWRKTGYQETVPRNNQWNKILLVLLYGSVLAGLGFGIFQLGDFVFANLGWVEIRHALLLALASGARVFLAVIISSIIWVPLGVLIGRHRTLAKFAQPVVQFCAAFPTNLLYPLAVLLILRYNLDVNLWVTILIVIGAQWYILFNVIAGMSTFPKEILYAAKIFNVKGWLWWRQVILPGIFPYYITGAITAAGGAWNLTIIAELISWGTHTYKAFGVGAYITEYTNSGDFHRVALGIGIMCCFVIAFNWILWRPMYNLAERRFKIS